MIGDDLIVVHSEQEMRAEVVSVLIIGPIVYILANSIYKERQTKSKLCLPALSSISL